MVLYTGDNATLQCDTVGNPPPVVSYFFNATRITNGVSGGALTLTSVSNAANTGPYQCFADNVRTSSSGLWVITVRDAGECYVYAQLSTLSHCHLVQSHTSKIIVAIINRLAMYYIAV